MPIGELFSSLLPAIGTGIGSFGGPLGGAIGSAVGSGLSNYFGSGREKSPFETEAEAAQMELLKGLRTPYNQNNFSGIENQARRDFNEKTIPGLQERFVGTGTRSGSGFRNALLQAGTGFESELAALRDQNAMQNRGFEQGRLRDLQSFLTGNQQLQQNANNMSQQGALGLGNMFTNASSVFGNLQQNQQQQTLDSILKQLSTGGLGAQQPTTTGGQPAPATQAAQTLMGILKQYFAGK